MQHPSKKASYFLGCTDSVGAGLPLCTTLPERALPQLDSCRDTRQMQAHLEGEYCTQKEQRNPHRFFPRLKICKHMGNGHSQGVMSAQQEVR